MTCSTELASIARVSSRNPFPHADTDELVQRLLKRAEIEGREDDTEDAIRTRQETYREQTEPLLAIYRERGLLFEVDGMGTVDEVSQRIADALAK